jgi:hypothetical protein
MAIGCRPADDGERIVERRGRGETAPGGVRVVVPARKAARPAS